MTPSTVTTLAQRELSDALRNRWFVSYAVAFVALSVALAMLVINSAGYGGVSGFGRTSGQQRRYWRKAADACCRHDLELQR